MATSPSPSLATPAPLTAQALAPAVVAGLALGLFAAFADRSIVTTSLGQMVTPWVLVAAFAGWRSRASLPGAAVEGGLALVVANGAYYVATVLLTSVQTPRFLVLWTAIGLVVGPAAAVTGRLAGSGPDRLRLLATVALAAVPIAEGVVLWGHIDHPEAHATYATGLGFGLLLPLWLLRREGPRTVAVAVALAALVAVPLGVIFEVTFDAIGIV